MATMRRRLRLRLRLGFGLAAGLAVLMLITPAAYGAKPKPPVKPTAAADQYSQPAAISFVTLTAAKVGKCKKAVVKRYAPVKKKCKGKKACLVKARKAEAKAKTNCSRPAPSAKPATKPSAKPAAKAKPKPKATTKKPAGKKKATTRKK